MIYQLSQTDVNQLQTLRKQIPLYYSKKDGLKIIDIIDRALQNRCLETKDIYEFLEVLPRIIPSSQEKTKSESENQNTDWTACIDEHRARYRREMERLHRMLSNWIFIQSADYRKSMTPLKKPRKEKLNDVGLGIKE